jgi:hypothetical protein
MLMLLKIKPRIYSVIYKGISHLFPQKQERNVHLVLPIYRSSVFRDSRPIGGYQVVSNLQLYLDLINHPLGGEEQAEWLVAQLKKEQIQLLGLTNDAYEEAFHETLLALGQENLNNLIVVGGWCPYLYTTYIWKKPTPES